MIDDMMINRRPQKQHLQFLMKKKRYMDVILNIIIMNMLFFT